MAGWVVIEALVKANKRLEDSKKTFLGSEKRPFSVPSRFLPCRGACGPRYAPTPAVFQDL